jgi:hypothetical protein
MSKLTLSFTIWVQMIFLCLNLRPANLFAGETYHTFNTDTLPTSPAAGVKDSVRNAIDSAKKASASLLNSQVGLLKSKAADVSSSISDLKKISLDTPKLKQLGLELPSVKWKKAAPQPFFAFNGAMVNYNFFYRANIDTPYAQKDVMQHTVTGNVQFTLAGSLPITVTYLARNSNSDFFRDIYDVRAEFDAARFRDKLNSGVRQKLMHSLETYKDSLTEKLYTSKLAELNSLRDWISNPLTLQRLYEMNEIARMPSITYDKSLPDSAARKRSDSLQADAKFFLDEYARRKDQYRRLTGTVDSLKTQYDNTVREIAELKQMLNGKAGWAYFRQFKDRMAKTIGNEVEVPKKYEWLLGIRKLSVGRSPVNYSELTAKNISLNGLNFEYNSWYYLAVSAGLIDYRFRDFSVRSLKRPKQYMYMLRLGLGQLERNYVILSFFGGRKQLYTTENASKGIPVTGLSLESKYQLAKYTFVIAEAAQSVSPDFHYNPPAENKFFDLNDRSNKAVSFKLYSYLPATRTRLEGQYKYTGANFQSFTSFQTNSAFVSWHVKADQQLWKRQLRITGSLRSNEFSNPYIIQTYNTNSIFKSLQVSFRKRKWPTASVAYMPVSQYTKLDNQVLESRFHTLNASLSHIYKLGTKQTATTIVVNRFYNSMIDTAFVYYNALNFVLSQNFFFKSFNASFNITQTKNPDYTLNVLDGSVQIPLRDKATFGAGAKVNNLNKATVKVGYYGNMQLRLKGQDAFYISFEKGYLTGIGNELIRNDFLTISFSKHF